jgi:hypothetical protein
MIFPKMLIACSNPFDRMTACTTLFPAAATPMLIARKHNRLPRGCQCGTAAAEPI